MIHGVYKDKSSTASSARFRCDTCKHKDEPIDSHNCKECDLNIYKEQTISDFIKREDAINVIWEYDVNPSADGVVFEAQSHIDRDIRLVPSADRPQGEWIVNISNDKSICSVCGANEADFIYGTEMWYGLGDSKFCPNCGARMKGAINDNQHTT